MTSKEAKYKVALYLKCWCDKCESDEYVFGIYEADVIEKADIKAMQKAFALFKKKLLREMKKYKTTA